MLNGPHLTVAFLSRLPAGTMLRDGQAHYACGGQWCAWTRWPQATPAQMIDEGVSTGALRRCSRGVARRPATDAPWQRTGAQRRILTQRVRGLPKEDGFASDPSRHPRLEHGEAARLIGQGIGARMVIFP
jgi:hypothetical protein